jgi:Integrase core domain/leucine-zipper of insertion element IS481
MKLHPNAKTTPLMRQLLVTRVRHQSWPQRRAAEAAGVSVRTVAKWIARHRAGDLALGDRSSRPHRMPRQMASAQVAAIIALRHARATGWEISGRLQLSRSTVTRVLARAGLNRLALLDPRPVIQRYEWPHAGDLLHVDIKPLGRIRAIGHRFLGPSVQPRTRGGGWEYAHVAVDDATRLAYVEVRRSQGQPACVVFLRHAVRWFARRGVRVRRILTDNGSAYRSHQFARLCRGWSLRHKFTRPYTPPDQR